MNSLNTILTAVVTAIRTVTQVAYELSIIHRPPVMQDLAATLPDPEFALAGLPVAHGPSLRHGIGSLLGPGDGLGSR